MSPEFWLQLAGIVAGGASIYAAIRSDLVRASMKADIAHERAKDAHGRIDGHINDCHLKGANHA